MSPSHRRAPWWRRVVAWVVDWITAWSLVFALQVLGVAFWIGDHAETIAPEPWGRFFLPTLTAAVVHATLAVVFVSSTGSTPGRELLGVRVVAMDGGRVTAGRALLRWSGAGSAVLLPPVHALLALVLVNLPASVDRRRRGLGDRLAGTWVVDDRPGPAGERRGHVPVIRYGMEKWLAGVTGDPGVLPDRPTD